MKTDQLLRLLVDILKIADMMLGRNETRDQPLGQSGAAAIVVSVLYFLGAAAIVANFRHTKFNYYKVLISSTVCEIPLPNLHFTSETGPPRSGVRMQTCGVCHLLPGTYHWNLLHSKAHLIASVGQPSYHGCVKAHASTGW